MPSVLASAAMKSIALAASLLVACGASEPPRMPAPPQPTVPVVDTSELDAFFRARFPADEPGIAVLIAKRGETVFSAGYGLADLETREPITTRTLFNVGSLSKTFVANAILILQERGKLSVDDTVATYFPGFTHPELGAKVTLRHLLTHTSGLPDNRRVDENPDFYLTARDAENWAPVTKAEALEFEPGSRFAYSNPAFNGLALIVEQVSGTRWQTFVHDEVFVPAGMATSTITDGPHPETGVAHGYVKTDGAWKEYDYGEYPTFAAAGNGGVWSSVEELAKYEHALRDGTFLSKATIADARTAKTFANWASEEAAVVGWSWFIKDADGVQQIAHPGYQGGFLTQYALIPSKDVLIVFLINGNDGTPAVLKAVDAELRRWLAARDWLD
jgi:CubicO group peptidase (beta-lactamase class C family)